MKRFAGGLLLTATAACIAPRWALAQDTTFRGVTINANYDPLRDKLGVVVLPIAGAFGDSVRSIIQRDLDFSDRFTIVPVDVSDQSVFRAPAAGSTGTGAQGSSAGGSPGLNYPLFAHLSVTAVVQITPVPTGLHVVLHDVGTSHVVNVHEFALPSAGLSRDWRMAVHQISDEIARWATGQRGIAATRIAYLRGASIRIVDSDGADEITVPTDENGISPAWSPDGSMLVYGTYGAVGSRLVLIDLSTGRSRTLLAAPRNSQYITPVFTPDGKSVVYSRSGENGSDLFIVGVDGGTPRRLTAGQGTENTNPTPSPDGRSFAFVSGRLGRPELYIVDADGTGVRVLTDYDFNENNYRSDPDWSPDGRLVAYQELLSGRYQIETIRAGGGTPKPLTSEGVNEQPSWAADARHLVFTSTRTGVRQLWIMDTESGRTRQLTTSAGSRLASWSPRLPAPR
jgi:TolB protein